MDVPDVSTARFTTCSEWDVIISKRFIIESLGERAFSGWEKASRAR